MTSPAKPKTVKALAKTRYCAHFQSGSCKFESGCMFAHHPWELRVVPNLAGTKICPKLKEGNCETLDDCPFAHSREELRSTDDVFKTSQCKFYDNGGCNLSQNCRFAHGADELRPKQQVPVQPPVVQLPSQNEYNFWSSANSGRRLSAIAAQIQKASRKNSTLEVTDETQTCEETPVSTL